MIKVIYQIADVHIPTYQKMDMYTEQLDKIIASINDDVEKRDLESEEIRIVLCGDLVHSNNIVSNELNIVASSFIRQLSDIGKVICIAGNHDLVESNTARVDTISAIFQTAQFDNAIFLDMELGYESGVVYDDNVTWAVYSYFDDFKCPDIVTARMENPDNKVIGLFHGLVFGCKLDNGYTADCGNDKSLFDGCDCVMAGHIHKRQELLYKKCKIVYSGSPIQQNYGETITQHGYAVWDVNDLSYEFVDIPSDYGYYKFSIDSPNDIENNNEVLRNY